MIKKCGECERELDVINFSKDKTRSDGLQNRCKQCQSEIGIQTRAGELYREKRFLMKFGINYQTQLKKQNGICDVCHQPPEENERLVGDHDHLTDNFRALIHKRHNSVLGFASDSLSELRLCLIYLEKFERVIMEIG